MNYLYTPPDATICYRSSDMVIYIESDTSYLVLPKARIWAAGVFFLVNFCSAGKRPQFNGIINVLCKKIKNTVSSVAKAETGTIFLNAQH